MYLTVNEVAGRYKVTKDCIWRWVRAGKFPAPVKLNGSTRWNIDHINEWEKKLFPQCDSQIKPAFQ